MNRFDQSKSKVRAVQNWARPVLPDWPEFEPTNFTSALDLIAKQIEPYLSDTSSKAITLHRPNEVLSQLRNIGDLGDPNLILQAFIELVLRTGVNLTSRQYMARQFSSVVPVSAAIDALLAMAPQPASFFEVGPLPNAADKLLHKEFSRLLNWPEETGTLIVTSGGSLANITALLAARNSTFDQCWTHGLPRGLKPMIAMGADAHYSLERAVGIIGLGTDNILRLPLNERRQICPIQAARLLDEAHAAGRRVFCLVASAGATATGAIDPLEELAHITAEREIWFHVDAAHSGAFLLSDDLRPRVAGLEKADSFCLDAHKTLFVPALCTLLFYRNAAAADRAFQQEAPYVFGEAHDEMVLFESGARNFECTKRASALNLWLTWAMYGRRLFERKLDYIVAITQRAHDLIAAAPDFVALHQPESNILCFRHCPPGLPQQRANYFQDELHRRLREDGSIFLSRLSLDGVSALRLVVMNHQITENDIQAMLAGVRAMGNQILKDWAQDGEHAA